MFQAVCNLSMSSCSEYNAAARLDIGSDATHKSSPPRRLRTGRVFLLWRAKRSDSHTALPT